MTNKAEINNKLKSQIEQFLSWFINHCTGYEKGEGQIFFDRLFVVIPDFSLSMPS